LVLLLWRATFALLSKEKSFSMDARDGIIYMTVEPYGPTIAHNYQS